MWIECVNWITQWLEIEQIELREKERDNCTTLSTQLNNETMCVDSWLEISTLFLSHTTLKWLIVFELGMWEHTHTHTHTHSHWIDIHEHMCVEMCREEKESIKCWELDTIWLK
jgi:hypothetical protein